MTIYTRILLAHSHAAMHRTALLLDRCAYCSLSLAAPTIAQAKWQARQQSGFLAWLDGGGFAQEPTTAPAEETVTVTTMARVMPTTTATTATATTTATMGTIENSGIAPLFPAPETGADEELQFSQVRIRDAVK
jgi:hypothetical protein